MIAYIGLALLAAVSFAGSAFFAGIEIGYYRLSQIKLSQRAKSRELVAHWWQFMVRHRQWYIVTVMAGANLCNELFSGAIYNAVVMVTAGAGSPEWLDPVWLSILIGTPFILLGAEIAPKRLFNRRADSLMYKLFIAVPAYLSMFLLAPFAIGLFLFSYSLSKVLKLSNRESEFSLSHGSLRYLIQAEASQVSAPMRSIALQLLDSHQHPIEMVMGRWEDAAVVAEDAPLHAALEQFRATDSFRLLVHAKDDSRRVVGSLSLFDAAADERRDRPVGLIMRKACLIPAATKVKEAVKLLQAQKQSLAAVVDETNRAVGVVSPELLSSELVASIRETGAGFSSSAG